MITTTEAVSRAGTFRRTADRLSARGEFITLYQLPTGSLRCSELDLADWLAACKRTAQQSSLDGVCGTMLTDPQGMNANQILLGTSTLLRQ